MPWLIPAAIVAAGAIGAGVSAIGSNKAVKASEKATADTNATNKAVYDTTRADLAPYNQAGQVANAALMQRYGLAAPATTQNAYAAAGDPASGEMVAANYTGPTGTPTRRVMDEGTGGGVGYVQYDPTNPGASVSTGPGNAYAAPQAGYAAPAVGGAEPGTYGNTNTPTYQAPGAFSYKEGDYKESDAYKFQLARGLDAIQSSQATRGAMYSGATAKAIAKFSQGLAAQDFGNERNFAYQDYTNTNNRNRANYDADRGYLTNRFDTTTGVLQNLSSGGQNAAAQTGNAGNAYASATGAANSANAANVGNAALTNASNINGLISTGVNAYAYGQGGGVQAPGVVNSLVTGGAVPRTAYTPYNNRTFAA